MPSPLTDETHTLLMACFADEVLRNELASRLENEIDEGGAEWLERIRYSIIRIVLDGHNRGDLSEEAFRLAKTDWRDVLVSAGHGDDPGSHRLWAKETIEAKPNAKIAELETMEAFVSEAGWALCPDCAFRFKPSDRNAWDGHRHRRCRRPLGLRQS